MNKNEILEKYLSIPRLRPYFRACGRDVKKGLELYQLNMRLGASFLPLLSLLEVSLRNGIDNHFRAYFNKESWWEDLEILLRNESTKKISSLTSKFGTPPKGYNDKEPLLKTAKSLKSQKNKLEREAKNEIRNGVKIYLRKFDWFKQKNEFEQLRQIETDFEEELKKRKIEITHSQLIASTTFGFWTSMLKKEIYKATNGTLLKVFPNRDSQTNFREISFMLDEVRKFRNRVAHNEPLCFSHGKFNLRNAKEVYGYIGKLLYMLNESLDEFSKETYLIHENIVNVEMFFQSLPKIIGFEEK